MLEIIRKMLSAYYESIERLVEEIKKLVKK